MDDAVKRYVLFTNYLNNNLLYHKIAVCPACGYPTLEQRGDYEVCYLCIWEDDPLDEDHPNQCGGANGKTTLNQYRKNVDGMLDEFLIRYSRSHKNEKIDFNENLTEVTQNLRGTISLLDYLISYDENGIFEQKHIELLKEKLFYDVFLISDWHYHY